MTTGAGVPRGARAEALASIDRRRDERGAGTVLVAGLCLALATLASAVIVLVTWVAIASGTQDAADLAALAGAGARSQGGDPCDAAREAARRNRGELLRCDVSGSERSFTVTVDVQRRLSPEIAGFPRVVVKRSTAGTG